MKHTDDIPYQNAKVLNNAVALGALVIDEIAGNDIADSVDTLPLNEVLNDALSARLNLHLSKKGGC